MEKHGLAWLVLLTLPALLGGCARELRGAAVPLAGDGQSSWILVETKDPDRNGIWWCSAPADAGSPPRCIKAVLRKAPES